jgi:signal peptidase
MTWGDNNLAPDQLAGEPPVSDNIVGKVLFTVPYVGVFPLVARPQGVGAEAMAAWFGRIAVFGALVYFFYLYFKAAEPRRGKRAGRRRGPVGNAARYSLLVSLFFIVGCAGFS